MEFNGHDLKVPSAKNSLITDVLTHILKNSLDHGIESNETRLKNNTPENGSITINASFDDSELSLIQVC